ncbi:MAG: 4Fe-4S dicluster domain-containing protein [Planctomycetes bacterium]|nr:4Fe-4S dicluster domain-containing protein [Planctomycetota bacterium]
MIHELLARLAQGHRTAGFPAEDPVLPDRFRGRPQIDRERCPDGCRDCAEACPTRAIDMEGGAARLDLGRCLFCTDCVDACPHGAIGYTRDYRLAARTRGDLVLAGATLSGGGELPPPPSCGRHAPCEARGSSHPASPRGSAGGAPAAPSPFLARALDEKARRLFGRSLKLRQVSAGGCNACEADDSVLGTVVFDLSRFGIQFVASPRHADGLLVTGPVSANMRLALQKTYDAVPPPRIVIAVGACAISGGPYIGHPEVAGGAGAVLPVDLFIPGCPPHPYTILDGLLRLLGRLEERAAPVSGNSRIAEVDPNH